MANLVEVENRCGRWMRNLRSPIRGLMGPGPFQVLGVHTVPTHRCLVLLLSVPTIPVGVVYLRYQAKVGHRDLVRNNKNKKKHSARAHII